jgi:hypothetical protein
MGAGPWRGVDGARPNPSSLTIQTSPELFGSTDDHSALSGTIRPRTPFLRTERTDLPL